MDIIGVKYVDYMVNNSERLLIKYYVCDVHMPIVSSCGLLDTGHSVVLDKTNAHVLRDGQHLCRLKNVKGLHFILPLRRRCPPETKQILEKHKDKLIVSSVPVSDYWKIEGTKAIRVHVRPRLQKFCPSFKTTMPGTEKTTDPLLHRLSDTRTTMIRFKSKPNETIQVDDNWMGVNTNEPLPESWTGETIFDYLPEQVKKKEETNVTIMEPDVDMNVAETTDKNVDYWTKDGPTWTRHHQNKRTTLFSPTIEPGGPDPNKLSDQRVTTMRQDDGTTNTKTDDWRAATNDQLPTWTGTTVFTEKENRPQIFMEETTDNARQPKPLQRPQEPTKEERELHELTHMPFRSWCPVCIKT